MSNLSPNYIKMKLIPLKRRTTRNPQIDSYVEAIQRGQKSYHIFPYRNSWKVKRIIKGGKEKLFTDRQAAVDFAKKHSLKIGGEVFVHNAKGLIIERFQ